VSVPQDILRRRALEYHQREERGSSCGSMAIDMDLILSGLVEIGKDSRLYVTDAGRAMLAETPDPSHATPSPEAGNG
jgi:hypothetical protein